MQPRKPRWLNSFGGYYVRIQLVSIISSRITRFWTLCDQVADFNVDESVETSCIFIWSKLPFNDFVNSHLFAILTVLVSFYSSIRCLTQTNNQSTISYVPILIDSRKQLCGVMNYTNGVYHSYLLCYEDNEARNINYVAYFLKAVKKVKMI